MDNEDIIQLEQLHNCYNRMRVTAQLMREAYDILIKEHVDPKPRYFNFDSNGDCVEVDLAHFSGSTILPEDLDETEEIVVE